MKKLWIFLIAILLLIIPGCKKRVASIEELERVNNKIIDYMKDSSYPNYTFNYVDEEKRVVVVGLLDNSKSKQKEFRKKVVDSNLIEFVKGEKSIDERTWQ